MNQIEFMRRWCSIKPAQVKRRTWHHLGMEIYAYLGVILWPIREPRCWWYFQRIQLHVWYGFPMPAYFIEA